ncbi:S-methyl-5-thioribose-1-phosphate isomerase [Trichlorobacter lovleyi]|uniref:Methylthioribose-1-phosphate isomerase n=1 Tax=Trichlorobacter lovleyi (strain ATCC BAA-1151 / DSM 17278 / SZ) TaxID=398767 RepID=MTNA_TRIL1|nr:S-methyl-5-thioribose-1-phosphate isomerase [Trichlorobacter lovleyi]B3E3M5.1 RecName: Full=Methylthioribose-1-phosphate isomerase; Short=M1Pi; Short=MTR-1-P isomerase; AltName: Full=S-methyl-5-thioribose-1-phosphate isomerase [Trichlorobacter lovleyi SZ]ACD97297.1 translation initiation factor, aIF-2BI family [Trichlorobacter lovleyi SZ]
MSFRTIEWRDDAVIMIDQTRLPMEEVYQRYTDFNAVAEAIRGMVVRGAPAIGVAAAMGVALGAREIIADTQESFFRQLENVCDVMARTRPTAVNLFWAIERMKQKALSLKGNPLETIRTGLKEEAIRIEAEDLAICKNIGRHGADLIPEGATILTHCNAGGLATAGYGTALGVIRAAHEAGKRIQVFSDETRPWLQGARLTTWELMKDSIPVTLISDNMAGFFMSRGEITCCVVGADRIAANGDTANKIGTFSVAVLAREHGIPFYVAAPVSTLDLSLADGSRIPIEERPSTEVTHIRGLPIAPEGVKVRNPSFDVTPAKYITAIITEYGVARGNYTQELAALAAV